MNFAVRFRTEPITSNHYKKNPLIFEKKTKNYVLWLRSDNIELLVFFSDAVSVCRVYVYFPNLAPEIFTPGAYETSIWRNLDESWRRSKEPVSRPYDHVSWINPFNRRLFNASSRQTDISALTTNTQRVSLQSTILT